MEKVLLFGGSFDPIHFGHLIISRCVAEALGVRRIVLIPSASPPHKQGRALARAEDRLAMCRGAVAGDELFEVSDWEIGQPGPNYTLLTVRRFRDMCGPGAVLWWLVGTDSLVELGTWYHVGELVEECAVVAAVRSGYERPDLARLIGPLTAAQVNRLRQQVVESPRIDISATDIRRRVGAGRSIRFLVPEATREYIAAHGLYRLG